ncbi:MAG: ATP/GTP-binding protein [Bdellovibrionota bacterium]
MAVRFIVLTGGPGVGKTAVMEAARQIFSQDVTILPEAASVVYSGGFPRHASPHSVRAAQRAIAAVQSELENFTRDDRKAPVALCDRGIADGAAYWPDGPGSFYASIGTSAEEIFSRYSTVIHLRTPAAGKGYDNSNPMRTENAAQALELCRRIERVWQAHPNRLVVPATETFTEKLEQVTAMIRSELMLQNLPSGKFAATSSARLVQEFLN